MYKTEFLQHTPRYVEIKHIENDGKGRCLRWSLPREVVEELVIWWAAHGQSETEPRAEGESR